MSLPPALPLPTAQHTKPSNTGHPTIKENPNSRCWQELHRVIAPVLAARHQLLLALLLKKGVVCVALDRVGAVEGVSVVVGPGGVLSDALGQVRVGDEVAAWR